MKIVSILLVAFVLCGASPARAAEPPKDFDSATRFIFYAVLEGLYDDVAQILMKKEKQSYFHFIYACPICTATIWALETYRARPARFYGLKSGVSTFGEGLPEKLKTQLYSEDSNNRLIAINTLVQRWIAVRMEAMHLPKKEHAALARALEEKRKDGMRALESFRRHEHGPDFGVEQAAPAYVNLEECAVCNGVVGKVMKLPGDK